MALVSIAWPTVSLGLITISRTDMTLVQASPEVRRLDLLVFAKALRTEQATLEGAPYSITHSRFAGYVISGQTFPDGLQINPGYEVEFEPGLYSVVGVNGNSNILDVKVASPSNNVSYSGNNSTGPLQTDDVGQIG